MKALKETQRLVTIGHSDKCDKSKCCDYRIAQSRVYPRDLYCFKCHETIKYEEQINWASEKPS